ncbi:hydroxyacid dehydrogenase [Candidatus Pacearchaeota archaeon]|nr:hydroxyacid dehydrogenase [Candidatus Pacearchaeota archaeon]
METRYAILINDGLDKSGTSYLLERGINPVNLKLSPEELENTISKYDGIIVRSATKVSSEIIKAGAEGLLKVIGRAGVGYDSVDAVKAAEYGIPVIIAPHGNTNATAELTIGLMLAVARNIPQAYENLRKSKWVKKQYEGTELRGKTLGIIGCGRIGKRVAQIAQYGFNMKILGNDIAPENGDIEYVSLEELLQKADFVTIHTPGEKQIIGEEQLNLMKPNAYLINTSRGTSVDEIALYNALKEKNIAGAALDVFEREGKEGEEWKNPLTELDNVVLTSHLGASSKEAQNATSLEIAKKTVNYLNSGQIEDGVNIDDLDVTNPSEFRNICRVTHDDKPGMFQKISGVFAYHKLNIRDMPSRRLKDTTPKKALTQIYSDTEYTGQLIKERLLQIKGVYRVTD